MKISTVCENEVLKVHPDSQDFPDSASVLDLLKVCGKQKDLHKGSWIHADVLKRGLLKQDIYVGTAILRMYAKCGALAKAQEVFDELPAGDVASWNALISGYAQHGLGYEVLNCFRQMRDRGLSPDAVTFVCVLKACGSVRAIDRGKEIHAELRRHGLLHKNIVLGTAVVDMYTKCGALAKAQEVFDALQGHDVVAWNALISGYAQHGLGDEALKCFRRMQDEGFSPNAVTFTCVLKACGHIGAVDKGEKIHAEMGRQGLLQKNVVLGNALVDMYVKCGALAKAQEVFNELPARDAASWNVLMGGYAQQGLGDEALNCFGQMEGEGLSPDAVTFVRILQACGSIGAVEKGEEIHAEVGRQGLLNKNIVLGTALVDMYAKCGALAKAQEVFDELPGRDVAVWNALLVGYAQQGLNDEIMYYFGRMRNEGFSPNLVTFGCVLKACGRIGATEKGEEILVEVSAQGLSEENMVLGTALVDMYANWGTLVKAQEVFDELPERDVVSWTALLAGYAQLGDVKRLFNSFDKMLGDRIEPNVITFVILLTACSHAGLLEEGQMYFNTMSTVYCIVPSFEHYTSMVDLFSRAGHFDTTISVIEKVPPSDCLLLWSALLGACQNWRNVELGKWVFERVVQMDEKFTTGYVCMRNIYSAAGMHEEADKMEYLRMKNGGWNIPERCSWTDVNKMVHTFMEGDTRSPEISCIDSKLNDIGQKLLLEGYTLCSLPMFEATSDEGKGVLLCSHGEKLGIVFALINSPQGTSIHITKNMRICGDCHLATALISKIEKRKILVRDASRIHAFEDGKCVCEEF